MEEYTIRRNLNRGYMKLEVWNLSMELLDLCYEMTKSTFIDRRLRSQILNACQSISSNIVEGYCRRFVNEYLQFLGFSLGSSGELYTRMLGLKKLKLLEKESFENFDLKHYELENKLLALVKSVQNKKADGTWDSMVHEVEVEYKMEE